MVGARVIYGQDLDEPEPFGFCPTDCLAEGSDVADTEVVFAADGKERNEGAAEAVLH